MSKNLNEKIIKKATDMFDEVELIAGYCKGSNPLKVSPCFIEKKEDLGNLVFNKLCINNLATYAYQLARQAEGSIGMVVKPCDSRAINQLVSEGLIDRDRFKLIAVG